MLTKFVNNDGSFFEVDVPTKEMEGGNFITEYVLYQNRLFQETVQYGGPNIYIELIDFTVIN